VKILITGSTGFLGKVLVRLIKIKNNNLYFITRKKNKNKKNNESKFDQIVENSYFFKTELFSNLLKIIKCK
jgi:NAD dependent epimerase/dehydratase family enzyme